jgi:hypothetical protein
MNILEELYNIEHFEKKFRLFFLRFWRIFEENADFSRILYYG